jgi:calpain-7
VQLKNPWSHVRWRGNYSELDAVHWNEQLQALLNYDPKMAASFDNGVFWIDYQSILKFYDVFYLNWDPSLFQFTYCIHQ